VYQVARKPSELFFPLSGTLNKTPTETWRQYAPLFQKYFTNVISPELLAALAQVEGSGNPVVRTYLALVLALSFNPAVRRIPPRIEPVGCTRSPTAPLPRRDATASTIMPVAEDGPWNEWTHAGSIACTRG